MTLRIDITGERKARRLAKVGMVAVGWAASSLVFAAEAAASAECDVFRRAMTASQLQKFSLAQQACASYLLPIAEEQGQTSPPPPQSQQLQLYDHQGVAVPDAPTYRTPPKAPPRSTPRVQPASPPRKLVAKHQALKYAPLVDATAKRHDIDPLLLHAIAHVESRHNPAAMSKAGALGIMQVMPGTAKRFGVSEASRLHDAEVNLEVSATYLKTLQRRFGNNLTLVLAAYNAGEGAVEKYGRSVPPYAETQAYVRKVLAFYDALIASSAGLR